MIRMKGLVSQGNSTDDERGDIRYAVNGIL
jgi:hypothetical protein